MPVKKRKKDVKGSLSKQGEFQSLENFDPSILIGALKKGKHFTEEDIDNARWEYLKKKHNL